MKFNDIIIAPATVTGTGAITLIRISGEGSIDLADSLIRLGHGSLAGARGYSLHYGSIYEPDGGLLDDVVISVFRSPRSYTGEDSVEICCHASEYIASGIIRRFTEAGCRLAEPGEFTQRAFLNGKMDISQAEAVADIIAANSKAAHRIAAKQLKGDYSNEFRALRDSLLEITALVELELDFSEEDVEFADREHLAELVDLALGRLRRLKESYRMGNAIKNGVPVAIVGAPNVGKSTLLNVLLGENRAIVSDIPGTTRDTIEETLVLDGVRYRFIDTAGIRETEEVVEQLGIERSLEKIRDAAIVICLLDAQNEQQSKEVEKRVREIVDFEAQHLIVVGNKCDLAEGIGTNVNISAKKGIGLDGLRAAIAACGYGTGGDDVILTSERQLRAVSSALDSLLAVRSALDVRLSGELLSQDLRAAIAALGSIFATSADSISGSGEITTEAVLGTIFSRFCIGK